MPARWVDLLLRINYVLDDADIHLSDGERNLFYAHLLATSTRRESCRTPPPARHPIPGSTSTPMRDVTGD